MLTANAPPRQPYPIASIIIPMYNVEKYIGECLESILAQTLQDFEVIVVNDCSPDNSRKVAETYLEKFGGRLKIFDNEKNSGPSVTRNNGLRRACGEYIFFVDSDDMIAQNMLEEMYGFAKRFNADVVNCTRRLKISEDGKKNIPLDEPDFVLPAEDVIMIEENLPYRISSLIKLNVFNYSLFRKCYRRKFLQENELFIPDDIRFCEDQIFMYGVFFCAKRIVHVPHAYYYYRKSVGSICRTKLDNLQDMNRCIQPLVYGIKWVDNVMGKLNFFKKNPKRRQDILESMSRRYFRKIIKKSLEFKQNEIYYSFKEEFGEKLGEQDVLISQLLTFVNTQQKKIAKLEEQLKTK